MRKRSKRRKTAKRAASSRRGCAASSPPNKEMHHFADEVLQLAVPVIATDEPRLSKRPKANFAQRHVAALLNHRCDAVHDFLSLSPIFSHTVLSLPAQPPLFSPQHSHPSCLFFVRFRGRPSRTHASTPKRLNSLCSRDVVTRRQTTQTP